MFLVEHPIVFVSRSLFSSLECLVMFLTSTLEIQCKLLTAKLLNQCYRYNNSAKFFFSKFYRRNFDLVSKFNVRRKSRLQQGLSEPDFYCEYLFDVYKYINSE